MSGCANECGHAVEAKKGLRGPNPTYCGSACRKEAKTKYLAERYANAKGERKDYDTINKPSATREYQRQKERESYRRHKTAPDKRIGLDEERAKANQKRWYRENQNRLRARARTYATSVTGKAVRRHHEHKRRATVGTYTENQLQARINFYGHRCYLCGCDWDALPSKQKHVEHVIPLSRGGTNWPANLRPACEFCNLRKGLAKLDSIL